MVQQLQCQHYLRLMQFNNNKSKKTTCLELLDRQFQGVDFVDTLDLIRKIKLYKYLVQKNNFKIAVLSITDEELNSIVEAKLNALKKVKATITTESSDKQTAVVKIKTNYVKITEVIAANF